MGICATLETNVRYQADTQGLKGHEIKACRHEREKD